MQFKSKNQLINYLQEANEDELASLTSNFLFAQMDLLNVTPYDFSHKILKKFTIALLCCDYEETFIQELPHFQDDENFIAELIPSQPLAFKYVSKRIKKIEYLAHMACNQDPANFLFIDDSLKNNNDIIYSIFSNMSSSDKNNILWNNVEIIKRKDKELIKSIMSDNQGIYKYLDEDLKNDNSIIELALQDFNQFKNLPESKKDDISLMNLASKSSGLVIKNFTKDTLNNEEIMKKFLEIYPGSIQWCGEKVKASKQIAKIICKYKCIPSNLLFLSEEIKNDKDIVELAILSDYTSTDCMSDLLKEDKNFILKLIENPLLNFKFFEYLDENIRNCSDIMKKSIDKNFESLKYTGSMLKHDKEFLNEIILSNLVENSTSFEKTTILTKIFKELAYGQDSINIIKFFLERKIEINNNLETSLDTLVFNMKDCELKQYLSQANNLKALNSRILKNSFEDSLNEKKESFKIKL